MSSIPAPSYDLVGIGFGPANLALAIALDDARRSGRAVPTMHFVERQQAFGWHSGLLLEGASMQVSFLKDLATQRDPRSGYTFLCYLHARRRLSEFINLRNFYPSRVEFHDYLAWCAEQLASSVEYGSEVMTIDPWRPSRSAPIRGFTVVSRPMGCDGPPRVLHATALALGTGLAPRLPPQVTGSKRVWHSGELLHRLQRSDVACARRFVVIGAGQSAAECALYLHQQFPKASVHIVMHGFGFHRAEDSAFVNRLYDPESVDRFYACSATARERIRSEHRSTNYGAVDGRLIDELFALWYRERVRGPVRLHIENLNHLAGVRDVGDRVELDVTEVGTGTHRVLVADQVVCATGYDVRTPEALMAPELAACICRDEDGHVKIRRDYRLETSAACMAPVFVHSASEATHGLSATLISNRLLNFHR